MARPLRLEYAGALYHVTSRGDRREEIYEDDHDREAFLMILGEVCQRHRWKCHAYCLMSNHYHLLIETVDATLIKGMRQLNGVYTQSLNRSSTINTRDAAITAAYESGTYSMREIGDHFDLHYSRVSRILAKRQKTRPDPIFPEQL